MYDNPNKIKVSSWIYQIKHKAIEKISAYRLKRRWKISYICVMLAGQGQKWIGWLSSILLVDRQGIFQEGKMLNETIVNIYRNLQWCGKICSILPWFSITSEGKCGAPNKCTNERSSAWRQPWQVFVRKTAKVAILFIRNFVILEGKIKIFERYFEKFV